MELGCDQEKDLVERWQAPSEAIYNQACPKANMEEETDVPQ